MVIKVTLLRQKYINANSIGVFEYQFNDGYRLYGNFGNGSGEEILIAPDGSRADIDNDDPHMRGEVLNGFGIEASPATTSIDPMDDIEVVDWRPLPFGDKYKKATMTDDEAIRLLDLYFPDPERHASNTPEGIAAKMDKYETYRLH